MSDEDQNKTFSSEDAALWEKVKQSLDSVSSDKSKSDNKQKAPLTETTTEPQSTESQDFAKLLQESEASPSTNKEIPKTQTPLSKPTQTKTTIEDAPSLTEDFAKLLEEAETKPTEIKQTQSPQFINKTQDQQNRATPSTPQVETLSHQEARNLSSGKQIIEGMIDLHGYTQAQAEPALKSFLKRAQNDGKRFLLVITGKGQKRDEEHSYFEMGAREPGVLRRKVPDWLDEMPETVVSYKVSHKKHGGEGALYVRLRRLKSNKKT